MKSGQQAEDHLPSQCIQRLQILCMTPFPAPTVRDQCRYCQDLPAGQRVPEADFPEELTKALALLSVHFRATLSKDKATFKNIAWPEVNLLHLLESG